MSVSRTVKTESLEEGIPHAPGRAVENLIPLGVRVSQIKQKAPPFQGALLIKLDSYELAVDDWGGQSNRGSFASSQVEWEVVSVALVHYFKAQVSAVEYISPGADYATLRVDD